MKPQTAIIIITFTISSCCSYEKEDLDFNAGELKHFSYYKVGDTIYYRSNLGDVDTITVVAFDAELNKSCGGLMAPRPYNVRWIRIKHLPIDKWHGTAQNSTPGSKTEIVYQELFSVSKYPLDKRTEYSISFKDFFSASDSTIGEFHRDTIIINNLKVSNYYIARHHYPERVVQPKDVEIVYWTDRMGLTAYQSKDGEIWTMNISR
jgi:hypothetical protein